MSEYGTATPDQPDDELDRELDRLVDTRNVSYAEARAILGIHTDEAVAVNALAGSRGKKKPERHYSHRGGRSYPEPSDSDLDPNWTLADYQHEPIDPDEADRRRELIEAARLEDLRERLRQVKSRAEWSQLLARERVRREDMGLPYTSETYQEIIKGLEEPKQDR